MWINSLITIISVVAPVICFFVFALCLANWKWWSGYYAGREVGRQDGVVCMQIEAIQAGYGEWAKDSYGNRTFRWFYYQELRVG